MPVPTLLALLLAGKEARHPLPNEAGEEGGQNAHRRTANRRVRRNDRVGSESHPAPRLKRSRGKMIQLSNERLAQSGKKALASAFVLVAMSASFLLAGQQPAHAADTFTVTNTNDDGAGSLRAAIVAANADSGADTIMFNISGTGVKTIKPATELPPLFDGTSIDGYSQLGSVVNTSPVGTNAQPLIELDGSDAGSLSDGLQIFGSNLTVKGLVINRFGSSGIDIEDQPGPDDASIVRLQGNFIGTDPTGTLDLGNGFAGVYLNGGGFTFVGGSQPEDRNVISGNGADGVFVQADNSFIQGNLIGLKKDGTSALGNSRDGVRVDSGQGNRISKNAISFNGSLGIDLDGNGITANDAGDADSGPNGLQNKPVIGRATTGGTGTAIKGSLNSTPNKTFTVEFYSNPAGESEGLTFLGEQSVTTDADGKAAFTFKPQTKVPRGQFVTATASSVPAFLGFGNTSEFSAAKKVVRPR